MGEYEMALEKLHIALRDEPKNTLVINEIQLVSIEKFNMPNDLKSHE